jgi:hypothetical protein
MMCVSVVQSYRYAQTGLIEFLLVDEREFLVIQTFPRHNATVFVNLGTCCGEAWQLVLRITYEHPSFRKQLTSKTRARRGQPLRP